MRSLGPALRLFPQVTSIQGELNEDCYHDCALAAGTDVSGLRRQYVLQLSSRRRCRQGWPGSLRSPCLPRTTFTWWARSWLSPRILLLVNRYVGLGLTLLGPVLFNILTFHLLMNPSGIGPGAFATLLWLLVAWEHRVVFERLFAARLEE